MKPALKLIVIALATACTAPALVEAAPVPEPGFGSSFSSYFKGGLSSFGSRAGRTPQLTKINSAPASLGGSGRLAQPTLTNNYVRMSDGKFHQQFSNGRVGIQTTNAAGQKVNAYSRGLSAEDSARILAANAPRRNPQLGGGAIVPARPSLLGSTPPYTWRPRGG